MNIAGIIAEYNPFHNGHLFHLNQAKKLCAADYVICVMSGHFLQRGEPAIFDKWSRAAMAIAAGADLVLELPFGFACRSAGIFARGGVELLESTKLVTHLCFGSEAGSVDRLSELAALLSQEPARYQGLLRKNLQTGSSYPAARSKAIKEYYELKDESTWAHKIIAAPNNILGLEYLNAIKRINSSIQPITIKRQHNNYHDLNLCGTVASATAIRAEYEKNGLTTDLVQTIPKSTEGIIRQCVARQFGPVFPAHFSTILLAALRRATPAELSSLAEVTEGLEYRLKDAANMATSLEELLTLLKSKRYTRTRLQRILVYLLLNFTKDLASEMDNCGPRYLRVLAISKQGQGLLRMIKKTSDLPIIHRAAEFTSSKHFNHTSTLEKMLQLDILATDLYALVGPVPKRGGLDYLTGAVRLTE